MRRDRPSVTALRVATLRAAHQQFDDPKVFDDPLAERILGPGATRWLESSRLLARSEPLAGLRAWIAARSRFAEEELARARARGVAQYVVLGAGLDTFAYRQPTGAGELVVIEVDHPATQAWKLTRLQEGSIAIPPTVRFVSTDFEEGGYPAPWEPPGFARSRPRSSPGWA